MADKERKHSLRRRIILTSLLIFLASIWVLSYYASRTLRVDIERLQADQQSSTVSYVAAELDNELQVRVRTLERTAALVSPSLVAQPAALQALLESQPLLAELFNSGVVAVDRNGTAIADVPVVPNRRGTSYFSNVATHATLTEGTTVIGPPLIGRVLRQPLFNINAPLHDEGGRVIGALFGVINLAKPNFLDRIGEHRYGKSGGYLVLDLQGKLIVTASDKSRTLQPLPAAGINQMMDRRGQGFLGSAVSVNSRGIEVLSSAARVPATGWLVVAALPTAEAFAPIRDMQRRILLASLLLTLVAGALAWWLLHRQFAPLRSAVDTLAGMSAQAKPQALPVAQQDEIGELIGGFNRLLGILAQREEALKESEHKLSEILESVDSFIYLKDRRGRYMFVNRRVRELLGVRMEQIVGHGDEQFFDARTVEQLRANDRQVLEQGKTVRTEETNVNLHDGRIANYLSVKLPLRNAAGEIYALCGISTDITEQVRERSKMELELAAYAKRLELASRRVLAVQEDAHRRFSGELHDRTSPNLAAIRLNLDVIARLAPEQEQERAERLADTRALVDDTAASVHDICTELRPPVLDYAGLVPALEGYGRRYALRTGIDVRVHCTDTRQRLAPEVESLLFRVYQEALANCVKHAHARSVAVVLRNEAQPISLTIADDGDGFDSDLLEQDEQVSGHGLLNMREKIEFFGGRFAIDSRPGSGTRIEVVI